MSFNTVCHIEWSVTDLERTKEFYGGLFGWKFKVWESDSRYMLWYPEGGIGGGFQKVDDVVPSMNPLVHILVEEVEDYLLKAEQLGGRIHTPKTEIPNIGWYGIITDPDGNVVGLFQNLPE